MRPALLFTLLLACGTTPSTPQPAEKVPLSPNESLAPPPSASGEVLTGHFDSAALGVAKDYWLYLPQDYQSQEKRYPVIYLLHGLGGSEDNWVNYMDLAKTADRMHLQAIVVMPDGDNSFYMNRSSADYEKYVARVSQRGNPSSPEKDCVKTANYEDYIANDLVSHIDASYRTVAKRSARAIGGLSMGGYGALMLAMRHPDLFSSVASHSGVDTLLYAGPIPYEKGKTILASDPVAYTKMLGRIGSIFLDIFGEDIANWQSHDPANLAKALSPGTLDIYIDCGTEDEFQLQHGASYLHEVLDSRSIPHAFALLPGGHNAAFWKDRIDDSLLFHMNHFAKARAN